MQCQYAVCLIVFCESCSTNIPTCFAINIIWLWRLFRFFFRQNVSDICPKSLKKFQTFFINFSQSLQIVFPCCVINKLNYSQTSVFELKIQDENHSVLEQNSVLKQPKRRKIYLNQVLPPRAFCAARKHF